MSMTAKFKFYRATTKERFLRNLAFAKKGNQYYQAFTHSIETADGGSTDFLLVDSEGKIVLRLRFDFYPDGVVYAECEDGNPSELESLLVFDLLEHIDEKAFVRFIDTKFFYDDGEFFVIQDGPNRVVRKILSDRNSLVELELYHIPLEIREEENELDFL